MHVSFHMFARFASVHICRVGQNCIHIYALYDHIFDEIPAKMPYVHRLYLYGSGQPYTCAMRALSMTPAAAVINLLAYLL